MTKEVDEGRRAFLRLAGGALGALVIAPGTSALRVLDGAGPAIGGRVRMPDRIGIQLYTVRKLMARDVAGTLEKLATIGYKEVEFAGLYGKSALEMRGLLDRNRLAAPSSHIGTAEMRGDWERTLADALALGQSYITCAWIDEADRTPYGYRKIAELFNRSGEAARKAGLQLCYHNHDFEFERMDDTVPYDLLLRDCDPDLVKMEMDIFWLVKGGRDPIEYFKWYPGRFPLVHVKDMDATGKMADVGKGIIGFPGIFDHAAQAGIEHCFVEHDEPKDPLATARTSYDYLHSLQLEELKVGSGR
ncbi:MAG TPA: sugar phosphate isomerase/epimerase [Gemmatimonadaceae bacterium]|nr:sugar phosphate isomerase/epimerase [Gemmatimonadaceae bacterium]